MDIRNHHYIFAHLALPQLFLANPARFLGALNEDGNVFLEHLWKMVAEKVPREEVLDSKGMQFDFVVDDDALLAIIRMPPAQADAEALLVACHFWTAPPPNPATPQARYFTLEMGGQEVGVPQTVFCEWEKENGRLSHVNYSTGPDTVRGFVTAIQDKVRPASRRS